ncbi:MAG: hypothetical protein LBB21_06100 [Holosporaceae bacterium]|jgi:hypothetical protein|nr:hypothetical protein [Holosporaceae bacterium]
MKKVLSIFATVLTVCSSYSIELLSPEGLESFRKLKHAEFEWLDGGTKLKLQLQPSAEFISFANLANKELHDEIMSLISEKFPELVDLVGSRYYYIFDIYVSPDFFDFRIDGFLEHLANSFKDPPEEDFLGEMEEDFLGEMREIVCKHMSNFLHRMYLGLLDQFIPRYYNEIVKQYRSLFKFDEENLMAFSEELPLDRHNKLEAVAAGISLDPTKVRLITANSILHGLELHGMVAEEMDFFIKLLQDATETSKGRILERFEKILKESCCCIPVDIFRVCDGVVDSEVLGFSLRTKVPDVFKENFMENIRRAILINSKRQTLIVFLAAHRYVCTYLHKDEGLFFEHDTADDPNPYCCYPFFCLDSVTPDFAFSALSISRSGDGLWGYGNTTVDASQTWSHELGHAIHCMLNICWYSEDDTTFCYGKLCYMKSYLGNSFLKELLFQDFDRMCEDVKQLIFERNKNFSDTEWESFGGAVVEYSKQFKHLPQITESLKDKVAFSKNVAFCATVNFVELMCGCLFETFNIIGLFLEKGILYVNSLSDLHSYVEQKKTIRWAYASTDFFRVVEKEVGKEPQTIKDLVHLCCEVFCATRPLNHPTPRSLQILEALHGLPDGLLVRSFYPELLECS